MLGLLEDEQLWRNPTVKGVGFFLFFVCVLRCHSIECLYIYVYVYISILIVGITLKLVTQHRFLV